MAHALYRSINYYNRIFCACLGILSRLTGSYLPFSKISGDDSSIFFLCDRSNSRASRQHLPKITKLATFLPHCFFYVILYRRAAATPLHHLLQEASRFRKPRSVWAVFKRPTREKCSSKSWVSKTLFPHANSIPHTSGGTNNRRFLENFLQKNYKFLAKKIKTPIFVVIDYKSRF
jgi:hypothetical protein